VLNKIRKNRVLTIFVCLLLVISLSACNSPKEPEKVELAQGVTDTEIKVGTLIAQSGPVAPIGIPVLRGLEAYFKMVNEKGGVNGRSIKLIAKDDEYNPQKAITLAEELVDSDKVFAIVGQLGTNVILATMDTFLEAGIPCVYQGGGSSKFTTAGPNYFPVQPNYLYEGKLFAKYAVEELEAKKVVFIYQNDETGKEGLQGFKDGLKHFNKEAILVEEMAVNLTDIDFSTQVQKAKEKDADLVILHAFLGPTTGILKEAKKVGFETTFLTQYANSDQTLMLLAGDAAEGVLVTGWVDITRNDQYTELTQAMAKYYPDQAVTSYVVAGWIAGQSFVEGLKLAGDNLSWEGFITAMEKMDYKDGLASRIKYGKDQRNGVEEMVFLKVVKKDGQLVFDFATDFIRADF
jgi:branched-chain amino acid transport system substrate-binding protein